MHSLVSFFCCCAMIFSISVKSGACHFKGQDSITAKVTSSVAMNGSFAHVHVGSLRAWIYRLCISALNFVVLYKLLWTVGDKRGLRLIHVHMLASMKTQNTFISRILITSFVAQSEVYLAASGKSPSTVGNWLSFSSSPTTNRMDKINHA